MAVLLFSFWLTQCSHSTPSPTHPHTSTHIRCARLLVVPPRTHVCARVCVPIRAQVHTRRGGICKGTGWEVRECWDQPCCRCVARSYSHALTHMAGIVQCTLCVACISCLAHPMFDLGMPSSLPRALPVCVMLCLLAVCSLSGQGFTRCLLAPGVVWLWPPPFCRSRLPLWCLWSAQRGCLPVPL